MPLMLSEDLLRATRLTETEIKIELAITLFQQDRLTLAQAARFAELPHLDFQRLLAARRIPLHYGLEAMENDLRRVQGLTGA